ncbi:MAG: hypothetical protein AB1918_08455, partial [Pseudomonadota bacterium]
ASFVKLHETLEHDAVDLLVTSSELENSDVNYLIQEMRNQRLGTNPFVIVIVLLSSAEPDYVKKVIDAGADDLLLTPVVPDQLIMRIEKLARARKPFVITHDYTGPDRRAKVRAFDSHSAPMLEAPNPLKARLTGIDDGRLWQQVREGAATLNRIKIERHAVQVDWLVGHIAACIRDGVGDGPTLIPYTHKLTLVAEDMLGRMRNTPAEAHKAPVAELLEIAKRLDADPSQIAFTDLERSVALSKTISRALGNPPTSVATAVKMAG